MGLKGHKVPKVLEDGLELRGLKELLRVLQEDKGLKVLKELKER